MRLVLGNRNFGLLWLGGMLSELGDWVLIIALPLYVYQRTESALATALVMMAKSVPSLVLGSAAGVFVDRWNRKRTMVVCNCLLAPTVLVLLLIPATGWLWVAYLSSFFESALGKFSGPAERAFLPQLVEKEDLATANSVNSLGDNIARFGGPPLGGILLGALGVRACVVADTLSFLIAALLISVIRARAVQEIEIGPVLSAARSRWARFWGDWLAGLRIVLEDRSLLYLFTVLSIAALADGTFQALVVPFILEVLHGKPIVFSAVIVGQGVGGIAGGLVIVALSKKLSPVRLMTLSLAALAILFTAIAALPFIAVMLPLSIIAGLPIVGWYASQQTLLQTSVPDRFRGRVQGMSNTTNALLRLVGLGAAGTLADRLGILPLIFVVAALYCLGAVLATRL